MQVESCICSEQQLCCAGFDVMPSGMLSAQKYCMPYLPAVQGVDSPKESCLSPEDVSLTAKLKEHLHRKTHKMRKIEKYRCWFTIKSKKHAWERKL